MNKVVNYYQYKISDRLGVLKVAALGESEFVIQWDREDEQKLDYKKTFPSKITFTGDAFHRLLRLETSIYRCDYIQITVERLCNGSTWIPWYSGRLSNNDSSWDLDRCEVVVKMDEISPDQCIDATSGNELNILSAAGARTVKISAGNIVLEKTSFSSGTATGPTACEGLPIWPSGSTPDDGAWAEYKVDKTTEYNTGGDVLNCSQIVDYARETITQSCATASPGAEWIVVTDGCPSGTRKWARPARLFGCVFTPYQPGFLIQHTGFECKIIGDTDTVLSIDNGKPLEGILAMFLNASCGSNYTVVSNFFQINPDVVSNINYVTGQLTKTAFITMFQKSDVKRPGASGNATKGNISFDDLLKSLAAMFNVKWRIEGNIFRIEHVSYFKKTAGLDLTTIRWEKWMAGTRKYTYTNATIPAQEQFVFMEATDGDFKGVPIIYADCVTQGRDNIITYTADKITTDVELVLGNPDPDSEIVQDDGFVLIACAFDGTDYFIITEPVILGNVSNTLNNSLAWAQLQRDYWKYDRPLRHGNMNNQETEFLTIKPTKRGSIITIPLSCEDPFNPDNTITTPLGVGIVDKAVYSFKNETVQLDLLYEANTNLTTNEPPIAVNDSVSTAFNTPVVIKVAANDIDENNLFSKVSVYLPPLHGNVSINPTTLEMTYTPNTGFTGQDMFLYYVYDNWSEPSALPGMVSIVVGAVNLPPVARNDGYNASKNTILTVAAFPGLFTNDSDDTGVFSLSAYDATSVQGGTVVVNGDGSFTYNPPSGYVGPDSFTYTIIDAGSLTSTATVRIDVRDANFPVANDDTYQTIKNVNLTVAAPGVLANDTTPIGVLSAVAGTYTTAQGGSVVLASDGSFTYTPPANYTGPDSVVYNANNGTGTDPGVLNVYVLPPLYVRLQTVNQQSYRITSFCAGIITDVGEQRTETVRLLFFSNSAGTVPIDVTAFGLTVNVRKAAQTSPGGGITNTDTGYEVSGTQFDALVNHIYYSNFNFCDGSLASYLNESFTLRPGLYAII